MQKIISGILFIITLIILLTFLTFAFWIIIGLIAAVMIYQIIFKKLRWGKPKKSGFRDQPVIIIDAEEIPSDRQKKR